MSDLAGCVHAVTPAPPSNDNFDPRTWLSAFKEAGGGWFVRGEEAHLWAMEPTSPTPREMVKELSAANLKAVRDAVVDGLYFREV